MPVNSFSSAEGILARCPLNSTCPLKMPSATTFAVRNGKMRLALQSFPIDAIETGRETYGFSHEGVKLGSTGTFDQLAVYLAEA